MSRCSVLRADPSILEHCTSSAQAVVERRARAACWNAFSPTRDVLKGETDCLLLLFAIVIKAAEQEQPIVVEQHAVTRARTWPASAGKLLPAVLPQIQPPQIPVVSDLVLQHLFADQGSGPSHVLANTHIFKENMKGAVSADLVSRVNFSAKDVEVVLVCYGLVGSSGRWPATHLTRSSVVGANAQLLGWSLLCSVIHSGTGVHCAHPFGTMSLVHFSDSVCKKYSSPLICSLSVLGSKYSPP